MKRAPYRIIIWGPGGIRSLLCRLIAIRPEYVIVGALCYSPDKEGQNVGEIAGIGKIDGFVYQDAATYWQPGFHSLLR